MSKDQDDLLKSLDRAAQRCRDHAEKTGAPVDSILAPLQGEGPCRSVADYNASGQVMPFVCTRTSYTGPVVAGSRRLRCDGCREEVWMSPATTTIFEQIEKKLVLCMECVLKQMPKTEAIE